MGLRFFMAMICSRLGLLFGCDPDVVVDAAGGVAAYIMFIKELGRRLLKADAVLLCLS